MLKKVREIVKAESWDSKIYGSNVWKSHIALVVKYARLLAKELKADKDLAELGALLHDIGSLRYSEKDHDLTGIPEAEKILKSLNYPEETIEEIRECIRSHRGSKDIKPKTQIAKIVSNADAMAHFDVVPVLLRIALARNNYNDEKAVLAVRQKLERDWTKKITIPLAKKLVAPKYHAAKILLGK